MARVSRSERTLLLPWDSVLTSYSSPGRCFGLTLIPLKSSERREHDTGAHDSYSGHPGAGRRIWHRRVDPREVRPHQERKNEDSLQRDDPGVPPAAPARG